MMETGSGIVLQEDAFQVRQVELKLNASEASRIAEQRGVSIQPQVIRGMEKGGNVADKAKLYGYLRILAQLVEEKNNGSAGPGTPEPEDQRVRELINNIRAQGGAVGHLLRTALMTVPSRDLRLLAVALENAARSYRDAAALLQGRANETEGNGSK